MELYISIAIVVCALAILFWNYSGNESNGIYTLFMRGQKPDNENSYISRNHH